MGKYLVDTTVLIDHLRGRKTATDFIDKTERLKTSFVVIGELFQGLKNKQELKRVEKLVSLFEIGWGQEKVMILAIDLLKQHSLKQGIGLIDSMIAATALMNDLILVTDNVKHFKFIKGLKVKKLSEVV